VLKKEVNMYRSQRRRDRATIDRYLSLGRGVFMHTWLCREHYEILAAALERRARVTVKRQEFPARWSILGPQPRPWQDSLQGPGYALTAKWSLNSVTNDDRGVYISGDCPQWRLNEVGLLFELALCAHASCVNWGWFPQELHRIRVSASERPVRTQAARALAILHA
jgi:hypothetical protein